MSGVKSFAFRELALLAASVRAKDKGFAGQMAFWIDRFGDRDIREIGVDDVEDALDDLRRIKARRARVNPATGDVTIVELDRPMANGTINKFINGLGSVWRVAHQNGYLRAKFTSPTRGLSRLPEGPGRVINVSIEDVRRLISAARLSRNRKLGAWVAFACTTGWRRSNIERMAWGDLDLVKGRAAAGTTKNGSPHWVPLLPWVCDELKRIRPEHALAHDKVFGASSIRKSYATALEVAGLPADWSIHTMRHVAASVLAQSGASTITIAQALNHKTMSMAARYSHQNLDTLRESVGRAWR